MFGAPRSGTTYLQQLVRSLKHTGGKIGQILPVATFHLVNQDLTVQQYNALCGSLRRGIQIYLSGEYNSRFRALEDWWQAPTQGHRFWHVIRQGARPQPHLFVYKEPFLCLAPEFALDSLPDARLIYIYRDGRDVANSLVESYDVLDDQKLTHLRSAEARLGRRYDERYIPWWVEEGREEEFVDSSPYVRAIWLWTYMVRRCCRYFEDASLSEQLLRIRYEELVQNPYVVGREILNYLEKESTRAFRQHLNRARTSSVGKYKRRPSTEIHSAEAVAAPMLKEIGYDRMT